MAQYKYFVFVVLTCFILSLCKEARCDSADQHMLEDCRQSLHLCNDAYNADEDLIRAQNNIIDQQGQYIHGLESKLDESTPLLPGYIWVIVGVAVGVSVMGVLK